MPGPARVVRWAPMPRRADETRELLLRTGQRLFARDGVHQVPLKAIVNEAGQRNASALHYHFGGRQGLLDAIIATHDDLIEDERRRYLAELDAVAPSTDLHHLVAGLVVPFSRALQDPGGREFLQIIAQLSHLFDAWDQPEAPEQARLVFHRIETLLVELPAPVRHLRVTTFLDLVTHALAARARLIEQGAALPVAHAEFIENLIEMCVGALAAPLAVSSERRLAQECGND